MIIRRTIAIVAIGLAVFVVVLAALFVGPENIGRVPEPPPAVELVKPEVTLLLDFGKGEVATVSTTAKTAFEALENVTNVKGIPVETKQYDFGVFVESIGEVTNTENRAWIYFVDGKAGKVAADKYELKDGDVVEWRYIKPE